MFPIDKAEELFKHYSPRRIELSEYPDFAPAAVLVPLFVFNEGVSLILTKRTDSVETHKGQIAFPGGMKDSSDSDLVATALRETYEELGVESRFIKVLGTLDDHPVPSGFIITPIVGFLSNVPNILPHSAEVAEVFQAPLSFFENEKNSWTEKREFRGRKRVVWFYSYRNHIVWGATAAIIRNLLAVLAPVL